MVPCALSSSSSFFFFFSFFGLKQIGIEVSQCSLERRDRRSGGLVGQGRHRPGNDGRTRFHNDLEAEAEVQGCDHWTCFHGDLVA
jgi:hypothetical protein